MKIEDRDIVLEMETWSIEMPQRFDDELRNVALNTAKNFFFLNQNYLPEVKNYTIKKKKMSTKK